MARLKIAGVQSNSVCVWDLARVTWRQPDVQWHSVSEHPRACESGGFSSDWPCVAPKHNRGASAHRKWQQHGETMREREKAKLRIWCHIEQSLNEKKSWGKKEAGAQKENRHQPFDQTFIAFFSIKTCRQMCWPCCSLGYCKFGQHICYKCSFYKSLLLHTVQAIKRPCIKKIEPYIDIHLRFRIKQTH